MAVVMDKKTVSAWGACTVYNRSVGAVASGTRRGVFLLFETFRVGTQYVVLITPPFRLERLLGGTGSRSSLLVRGLNSFQTGRRMPVVYDNKRLPALLFPSVYG